MRIVILATEPSGDFLGAKLIKNLKKNKKAVISGVGGEQMKVEGFQSWVQINQFNAIGIFEVLIRILKFIKLFFLKILRSFSGLKSDFFVNYKNLFFLDDCYEVSYERSLIATVL